MQRPKNPFEYPSAIIAHISMTANPFEGILDAETIRVLRVLEARTWNVVRAACEIFWCQDKAWKTYRLSSQDTSKRVGLRPSDQLEIYWWSFINYIYQFKEKIKLYSSAYNELAPIYQMVEIPNVDKSIRKCSYKLKKYISERGRGVHEWHIAPEILGQLSLIETMQEQKEFYRKLPGTGYLDLPPKFLFRRTRHDMHEEMEHAMSVMANIAKDVTNQHIPAIYAACYKLTSYTQWAKDGQLTLKFG